MMQCYPTTFLQLSQLRFGHEHPAGAVNIRKPTRADAAKLVPSIRSEGLLQALFVCPDPNHGREGPYYVVVGGRRLLALHIMRENGELDTDAPISTVIGDSFDAAVALGKSLAAEDSHVPPHPVDRYEAFAALSALGLSPDDIAARFFIDKTPVRQALALGALAPEVRTAWRAGEIDAAIAQNFTLADSHPHQVKVLNRLRKKNDGKLDRLDAATVRKQFTGSEAEANRLLKFVGRTAYVDAGGALTADLFTTSIVVHDIAKLKRLAEEKLEREATRLTKGEGWSWAEPELKTSTGYHGQRLPVKPEFTPAEKRRLKAIENREQALNKAIDAADDDDREEPDSNEFEALDNEKARIADAAEARAYDEKQKAKAGCVIRIGSDGGVMIDYGIVKPKETPSEAGIRSTKAATPSEPELTHEAVHVLFRWKSAAAGEALVRKPECALAAFLARMQCNEGPIAVETPYGAEHEFVKAQSFRTAFTALSKLSLDKLTDLVVKAIADSVHFDGWDETDPDEAFLLDALDQDILGKALQRNFDGKTYFAGASKPHLLDIIEETLGPDECRRNADKSKTDLAKFCKDSIAPLGWLPTPLRTRSYTPPTPRSSCGGDAPRSPSPLEGEGAPDLIRRKSRKGGKPPKAAVKSRAKVAAAKFRAPKPPSKKALRTAAKGFRP